MRTLPGVKGRGDRGAVLILVAVFALVAIVMLAAVVDLGAMRSQKRNVTLSTDAAALAAASSAVLTGLPTGTYPCSVVPTKTLGVFVDSVARQYLIANGRSVPTPFPCEVEVTGVGSGFVVVGSSQSVEFRFGKVGGNSGGSVAGETIAAIRSDLGGGLRPIGVCNVEASLNTKVGGGNYNMKTDVLDAPKGVDADGNLTVLAIPVDMVIEKEHQKKNPNACGTAEASGQRGQLNFDNENGNGGQCDVPPSGTGQTYAQDIGFGYFGNIEQLVEPDSGNDFTPLTRACLSALVDSGQRFWLPVYDNFDRTKGVQTYRVTHFIEVSIRGYCLNNGEYQPSGSFACQFPTSNKKADDVDWFWFKIYRAYKPSSFPASPPKTSDAKPVPPAICGEKDTADARNDCK